jgi:hypothetical protein
MGRLGAGGAVLALLALTACGSSQEREKQARELAAAERQVAEARAFNEGLERERKQLTGKLMEAEGRLAELRGAYNGTLAAAAYLAEEGHGLVLDEDMRAAREGFLLAESLRQKDPKATGEVVARVLEDARPCAATTEEQGDSEAACGPCEVAPFEDTCVGVEPNLESSLEWSCAAVARSAEGVPPAAFCTSTLEHPAPGYGVESPYSERGLPTSLQVVRIAFAHQGRLYVSDYPKPEPTLYNPPNVEPLVQCKAETARNECIHKCEVRFERYVDPCACETGDEPDEHDHEDPEEGDEEDGVPAEVREARRAAAEAEAEAEEARKRALEAQQEVEYQECLAACEPGKEELAELADDDDNAETHVEPESIAVTASLEATPAPGVFVVSRDVRELINEKKEVLDGKKSTLVLKHPGLVALWQKKALPDSDTLGVIETVGQLDEVLSEGGKPSLAPLPGMEGPTLAGLSGGKVKAYAFKAQAGQEPVVELDGAAVCAALRAGPKRFPESFAKACPEAAPPAPVEPGAGAPPGAAPESKDAGAPDAAVEGAP